METLTEWLLVSAVSSQKMSEKLTKLAREGWTVYPDTLRYVSNSVVVMVSRVVSRPIS